MHSQCVSVRTREGGRQSVALVSPLLAVSSARVPPASGCVSLVSAPQPVTVPRSLRRVLVILLCPSEGLCLVASCSERGGAPRFSF